MIHKVVRRITLCQALETSAHNQERSGTIDPLASKGHVFWIVVKCFHDYPSMKESSAFIFCIYVKELKDFRVGKGVLRMVSR